MIRTPGPSTPVHTCSHCPFLFISLHWPQCLHCLHLCIPVYTCQYLFTPAHTCPHSPCFANIHAPFPCSHPPMLALHACRDMLPCVRACGLTLLRGSLGALRLKVRLVEDRVLPSRCYQPLLQLLMESALGPAEVGGQTGNGTGGGGGSGCWPPPASGTPVWALLL